MNAQRARERSEAEVKEELLKLSGACETASLEEMRQIVAKALRILSERLVEEV